jgi:hypothetical protein
MSTVARSTKLCLDRATAMTSAKYGSGILVARMSYRIGRLSPLDADGRSRRRKDDGVSPSTARKASPIRVWLSKPTRRARLLSSNPGAMHSTSVAHATRAARISFETEVPCTANVRSRDRRDMNSAPATSETRRLGSRHSHSIVAIASAKEFACACVGVSAWSMIAVAVGGGSETAPPPTLPSSLVPILPLQEPNQRHDHEGEEQNLGVHLRSSVPPRHSSSWLVQDLASDTEPFFSPGFAPSFRRRTVVAVGVSPPRRGGQSLGPVCAGVCQAGRGETVKRIESWSARSWGPQPWQRRGPLPQRRRCRSRRRASTARGHPDIREPDLLTGRQAGAAADFAFSCPDTCCGCANTRGAGSAHGRGAALRRAGSRNSCSAA